MIGERVTRLHAETWNVIGRLAVRDRHACQQPCLKPVFSRTAVAGNGNDCQARDGLQ